MSDVSQITPADQIGQSGSTDETAEWVTDGGASTPGETLSAGSHDPGSGEGDSDDRGVVGSESLEDEGDIAADYIEELLDICDLDGDIDIDARAGRAYVSVNSSEDSNLRLLSSPDTVQALQELTRLAVQTKTGGFSRLILDVGGSRQIREAELSRLVDSAIQKIESGGSTSVALEPMSSYERKVVHDLVSARGYVSASEGDGRDRHTVVSAS